MSIRRLIVIAFFLGLGLTSRSVGGPKTLAPAAGRPGRATAADQLGISRRCCSSGSPLSRLAPTVASC